MCSRADLAALQHSSLKPYGPTGFAVADVHSFTGGIPPTPPRPVWGKLPPFNVLEGGFYRKYFCFEEPGTQIHGKEELMRGREQDRAGRDGMAGLRTMDNPQLHVSGFKRNNRQLRYQRKSLMRKGIDLSHKK